MLILNPQSLIPNYYYADGLGSIRQLTDSSGSILNQYRYGSWGEITSPFSKSESIHNSYLYTSRELSENNLHYYRSRYYQKNYFVSKDRIVFGDNLYFYSIFNFNYNVLFHSNWALKNIDIINLDLYKYAENNPINYKDPFGRESCSDKAKRLGWSQNQCEDCCDNRAYWDAIMCATSSIIIGALTAGPMGLCTSIACTIFIPIVYEDCKKDCRKNVKP